MNKCKNCKFCYKLKHNFKLGKGFEHDVCCTYLYDTAKGFIMQVVEDGEACEVYKER